MNMIPMNLKLIANLFMASVIWSSGTPAQAAIDAPLLWRWSNPRHHGNNIVAMAHRNGWVIQVGERGQIYTSQSLDQWTPRESPTSRALRSVTFFGEKVVITGETGTVLVAAGIQPLHRFQLIDLQTTDWLESVANSPTLLVAVGDNGAIYTSPDAISWTRRPQSFSAWLRSVAFGNGTFVTVGEGGFVATSPDGQSWQTRSSGVTDHLNRVVWVPNRFVAAGESGRLLQSADGINWQPFGPGSTNTFATVAANDSTLLAAGVNELRLLENGIWSDQIRSSTGRPAPNWTYLSSLWDGTLFLLGGRTGRMIEGFKTNATSPTLWVERNDSIRNWLWDLYRTPEFYIAVGDRATVMTSEDGIHWELELVPASLTNAVFLGVGGNATRQVIAGNQGRLMTSTNGVVWQAVTAPTDNDLQGVTFGHGQFIVTGGNGTILSSDNGLQWTPRNSSTTAFLSSVVSFPGGFLASGSSGTILQSPDGRTWARRTLTTTNWIYRIRYLNGTLVAVGQNGTILTSTDGNSWAARSSGTTKWLNDATFVGDRYVVVGMQGAVLQSRDLVQWNSTGTITEKSLFAASAHTGQLLTAGVEGVILRSQVVPDLTPILIQGFSRKDGQNLFLFVGRPDQQFTLDRSINLSRWASGTPLEFFDGSSTLLHLEESPAGLAHEFFRARLRVQ